MQSSSGTREGSSRARRTAGKFLSQLGTQLASPLGILLVLPGLVSLVGTFLTLLGEHALRGSNLAVARERMLEQATLVASGVRDALEQAEPMLEQLNDLARHHGPSEPYQPFAHALLDLMKARAGVSYVSVSFPDGTFQGTYLEPDGALRFQDSRVLAEHTRVLRFAYGERDQLELVKEDHSAYDPRVRGFYELAVREGRPVWTEPYLFYDSQTTGITRTSPVYVETEHGLELYAVTTIDFDVLALSSFLQRRQLTGMRVLLYASDGTILAHAGADVKLASPNQRPVRFDDLADPLLTAFFTTAARDGRGGRRVTTVETRGERYLAAISPVGTDLRLGWSIAYLVPERRFMRELHAYEDRSLWIAGFAVLLSTLFAYLFARHITRVRQEAELARREAREARAMAREARAEARELGSYTLVACLGRGGMGEVWRAQHRLLAREAAIKLIKTDEPENTSESMRERFRREAEALAKLRSRNTIELFDYGVADDGTFYLVMELLDGLDFDSLVIRYGPQPPERVVYLLIQVCNSLQEAHEAGLVHRDIKPANLFVCRAAEEVDVVKVLDFGLVRGAVGGERESTLDLAHQVLLSRLTNAEGLVGTPGYMAPEQAQGQATDGRTDLYALGAVAHFLLTGKPLYPSENPIDQIVAHLYEPVPDLRQVLGQEVPDELVSLIASCLAKRPEERPESAKAIRRVLREMQFPADRSWSEERAQAFWSEHLARRSERPPVAEPRALQVAATLSSSRK